LADLFAVVLFGLPADALLDRPAAAARPVFFVVFVFFVIFGTYSVRLS